MFCTECGTPLPLGQKFCTNCGARADADTGAMPPSPQPGPSPAQSPAPVAVTAAVTVSAPATDLGPSASASAAAPRPVFVPTLEAPRTTAPVSQPGAARRPTYPRTAAEATSRSPVLLWGTLAILTLLVIGGALYYFYRAHQTISDATIVQNVKAKLYDDVDLRKCTIEVIVQNGVVTLVGLVNSRADKANALQIAHQQQGVKQVVNQLVDQSSGGGPSTSVDTTSPTISDASIVENVKAKLYDDVNLRKCTIDVTAQNGVVTLVGLVNSGADKANALQIAHQQQGVRQVVNQLVVQSSGGTTRTIDVPGNQGWTPTGIFLSAGDVVEVSATGNVSMGAGWPPMPPSGRPPDCGGRGGFPAGQFPCWSLIGRIGDQGEIFYVGSKIRFQAPTSGQLLLGVNDDILGDNRGSWTATVNSTVTGPRLGYAGTWLGFANETGSQDREAELHKNCGADFRRAYVPPESGNRFTDLCRSVGKTCERVCDWEGRDLPCSAVSLGGQRDGTRIALCR